MTAGFKAGDIMCVMNGPWRSADHLSGEAFADPSNLVIAPIPEGTAGNTGSPVGGHNYVVYALVADDPDKQAAVLDLLAYINGTDAQAYLATDAGPPAHPQLGLRQRGRRGRSRHLGLGRR